MSVFKPIPGRWIPSTKIVPGYGPAQCPKCGSLSIQPVLEPVVWKHLVAVGIEMETEQKVPVYRCAECGFILSRAFREKETVSMGVPLRESYFIEGLDGRLHHLVSDERDPIRQRQTPVEIIEARRVLPPYPMSALVVKIGATKTYSTKDDKPVWCELHRTREVVQSKRVLWREFTLEELRTFSEMVQRVRAGGYKPSKREGALAFLVSCIRGTLAYVAGFLQASGVSEFRDTSMSTVGQSVSRMEHLGLTPPETFLGGKKGAVWRIAEREPSQIDLMQGYLGVMAVYMPVNRVLLQKEYILRREAYVQLRQKPGWWKVLDVPIAEDVPRDLGLTRWF